MHEAEREKREAETAKCKAQAKKSMKSASLRQTLSARK